MRSKNHAAITAREREHLARVKALSCSVCDAPGPSDAHHIRQEHHLTTIALCEPCHRGPDGWHGTRRRWTLRKFFNETDALQITLARLP